MEKPDYLYKYCSLERGLQILKDCELFLCPPQNLNDLFELSVMPHVEYNEERAKFLEHVRWIVNGLDEEGAMELALKSDKAELKRLLYLPGDSKS